MKARSSKRPTQPRAATSDVLGTDRPEESIPPKWKAQYNQLKQLRDSITQSQGELAKDATEEQPAFSLHMADAGTDSFDRDLALSRLSSGQDAVYEIDEAMARIRDGTYGVCEVTGKPIEPRRLAAIPWTRFSTEAEQQLEHDGQMRRSQLAPRKAINRSVPSDNEDAGSNDEHKTVKE